MEGPGRVSHDKLTLWVSDDFPRSAPTQPYTYQNPWTLALAIPSAWSLPSPDPYTAHPSPTHTSAETSNLKETPAAISHLSEVSLLIYFPS